MSATVVRGLDGWLDCVVVDGAVHTPDFEHWNRGDVFRVDGVEVDLWVEPGADEPEVRS